MALTEMIAARVDKKIARRIADEAKARGLTGKRVAGADITREALIEYFARKDAEKRNCAANPNRQEGK